MAEFEQTYKDLNAAQKKAVDAIEGPVLVIAGPGTGKTQLLTMRIANILDKTDTLPANILCLTFTDSAAHTMRERLTSIIGQAAYNVTISTYHAFGSELIRRYPEFFVSDSELQPVDDLMVDTIFRDILVKLPYSNPLRHDIFLRDIKTLISDCKRALHTPNDIRTIATANETFITTATTLVQKELQSLTRVDKKAVPLFEKLLAASRKLRSANEITVNNVVNLAGLWNDELEAAVKDYEQTGKTTTLTKWKNAWLAKNENGEFVAVGIELVRKLRAAATIYERYLTTLAELGLYDYDDMILRAIRGLEAHTDLRYTLQEQYLYILLDEFQDTNEAQLRLVELLSDSPVHEGRPNVMAVGDDDQAIYAFQGAHYSHMLSFIKRYREVLTIPLTANYRSAPDILHVAKGIAGQIEERLHEQLPGVDKTITAAAAQTKPAVVERLEFKSDLSQYAWVAQKIAEQIKQGTLGNEIAVLAPKHEYLEALVPFLHQQNLPVHYDKRENVLDDPAIRELVAMSRLVLALAARDMAKADSLWPEVLSFHFWGLTTAQVWELSWTAHDTKTAWTDVLCTQAITKPIALFFIRLSQLATNEPMEHVLDLLIGTEATELGPQESYRSPFYEHYFGTLKTETGDTISLWQLLSNLTVIRQHLREYRNFEATQLTLNDFTTFVEAHQAANIKIINTNPYQEATDAVELMTAYKAKGQEFMAVFILACIDEVWGGKARNVGSRLSLPANLQFIRYAGTTDDERLRLLYVALTRAKTELYLTSYISSYTGRLTTRLKFLDERQNDQGQIVSPLLPTANQDVKLQDHLAPELAELTVYWQHRHYRGVKQPKLRTLLAPRLEQFQLSPTHLNRFVDVTRDGPATFFTETLLRFPSTPTPASQYGSAVHETLEWIDKEHKAHNKPPTARQATHFFEQRLAKKHLNETQTLLLMERGRECLPVYLKQATSIIGAPGYSEFNFRNEGIFAGPAHLNGKIDKLLVDPQAKTITIIDYKTGRSHQRWANEPKLHAFKQQLYSYKMLVERSHSFAGYSVTDAYLLFVESDATGHIRELHLNFEAAQLSRLEKLYDAVWQHIMALDFPDVSSYSPNLKGITSFEDDLISGTV